MNDILFNMKFKFQKAIKNFKINSLVELVTAIL